MLLQKGTTVTSGLWYLLSRGQCKASGIFFLLQKAMKNGKLKEHENNSDLETRVQSVRTVTSKDELDYSMPLIK